MGFRLSRWSAAAIKTKYELRDGDTPMLVRLPEVNFIDDKARQADRHQPAHRPPADRGVRQFGRRSADARVDAGGSGARLMMLVHHDDAEREFAYGTESKIGTFSDALMAEAEPSGWTVISMKNDWKRSSALREIINTHPRQKNTRNIHKRQKRTQQG